MDEAEESDSTSGSDSEEESEDESSSLESSSLYVRAEVIEKRKKDRNVGSVPEDDSLRKLTCSKTHLSLSTSAVSIICVSLEVPDTPATFADSPPSTTIFMIISRS